MESTRSSLPPASVSLCPACGKPVDTLRAGHVAILDGKFTYFCDASCKQEYVRAKEKGVALEIAETAQPPQVAPISTRAPIAEPPRSVRSIDVPPPPPSSKKTNGAISAPSSTPHFPRPEESGAALEEEMPASSEVPAPPSIELAPASDTTPESHARPAAPASVSTPNEWRRFLPGTAATLGVLAAMIALAGPSVEVLRFPLAALSFVALSLYELSRRADASESPAWSRLLPALVATIAATAGRVTAGAQAPRLASFAGLVCATLAVAAILAVRARKQVQDTRIDLARRLAVSCRVSRGEDIIVVDASEVKPGTHVLVEPGETVGVDGVVASGEAEAVHWLDAVQAGKKREGDAIVAGARIVSGKLRVLATFTGNDRAFARVLSLDAQRADVADPQLTLARRSLERATPGLAIAAGGFAFGLGATIPEAIAAAASALAAFAVPGLVTAMSQCLARAQLEALARGVVYKDARAFDTSSKVDVAVVCSRGTVLLGEPELVSVEAFGIGEERVISLAAGAETSSSHPFALAITHAAKARKLSPEPVRSAVVHTGLGVTALAAGGDRIVVGSRAFLLKEKVSIASCESNLAALTAQGRSVLLVAFAEKLVGLIALQDGLRPGARAAMRRLHDARIEPVLLSGEARDTCETIARALEIDHVRPEVLSQERGQEVRALREGGHAVAVIGHATTDDGALGAADASVALAALGTTPAEWAVGLASDDVRDAALALTLPKAAKERARRVLLFGLPLAVATLLGSGLGLLPVEIGPLAGIAAFLTGLWGGRQESA